MLLFYVSFATLWLCVNSQKEYSNSTTGGLLSSVGSIVPLYARGDVPPPRYCRTPSQQEGTCIPVRQCRTLWDQKNWRLIRRSACGMQGETPKVCCPISVVKTFEVYLNSTTSSPNATTSSPNATTSSPNATTSSPGKQSKSFRGAETQSSTSSSVTEISSTPARASRRQNQNLFSQGCGRSSIPQSRIIGGQEATVGAWPWMAVLYLVRRGLKSAECGGVLVTAKHVITAAHCTVNSRRGTAISPSNMLIRLADHDLESEEDGADPLEVTVRTVVKHERFNLRNFQNDIAILELTFAVDLRQDLLPICLPFEAFNNDNLAQRNAFAAGWGTTSFGGPASPKLQEVQLRIWENGNCEEVFKKDVPITNVNLCAGDGDKDACRGDSGGPLMLSSDSRFYLIGIVSFGRKCAEPGVPGVYTRVTSFLDWIEEKLEQPT